MVLRYCQSVMLFEGAESQVSLMAVRFKRSPKRDFMVKDFIGTVRLVWQVLVPGKVSKATLGFDANGVSEITNDCMDMKGCLKVFGDVAP